MGGEGGRKQGKGDNTQNHNLTASHGIAVVVVVVSGSCWRL